MAQVTLRDLADRLGVGKSTVQRALAGSTLINERTRKRVLAEAEACGYRHDAYFAALSAKRLRAKGSEGTGLLLHYLHHKEKSGKDIGFNLGQRLAKVGENMGFEVRTTERPEPGLAAKLPELLWRQGSSGIFLGHVGPELRQAVADFRKLPILCCQRLDGLPYHTVRFAVNESVRMAWNYLWDRGARRIGCAIQRHEAELDDDTDRLGAAEALLRTRADRGARVPPLTCPIFDDAAYVAWLRAERPDAVMAFRAGLWFTHREAGFGSVPFVTLNAIDTPESRHIPGVRGQVDVLVRELLIRMDSMVRHGDVGVPKLPVHSVISPEWWEGR